MDFLESIKIRAKANKKTVVLPEANDIRTLTAAAQVLKEGLANIILIGNKDEINKLANGLDISKATIIDPCTYDKIDFLAKSFYEIRKSKGLEESEAKNSLLSDSLYFSVMLVKEGLADGMVAGAVSSTANVLRPSLQILKTAPKTKLVSSYFVMVVPNCEYGNDGVFIFSDCGLVQNPNAEELAAIAVSSANSYRQLLNDEPIVAMLSHSTKGSAKHDDVTKVVEATKIAKELAPELLIEGEFQADAAIVPSIGASKAPGVKGAGQANVLIFPDLDAGNIAYKLVERLAKGQAFGPLTQGIAMPVNDLSRGCSADDIVGVIAITAVQAQSK